VQQDKEPHKVAGMRDIPVWGSVCLQGTTRRKLKPVDIYSGVDCFGALYTASPVDAAQGNLEVKQGAQLVGGGGGLREIS
jgi:hypothetical protein